MPAAARLGDKAQTSADAHGCPACPHAAVGPIVKGSTDVFINGRAAARMDDVGVHSSCCGANTFKIVRGSPTVYVNGKPLGRMNDKTQHCGGTGPIIEGSPDVSIDDGCANAASLTSQAARTRNILVQQAAAAQTRTIVVQLVDDAGAPVAGASYRITLPDGKTLAGQTDGQGYIRVSAGTLQGDCILVVS